MTRKEKDFEKWALHEAMKGIREAIVARRNNGKQNNISINLKFNAKTEQIEVVDTGH
jgi:hypothetical protein